MLLEVNQLRIAFTDPTGEDREVVREISFGLEVGQSVGIVGESGSGKSATALAIMGLLPQSGKIIAGEIKLMGVNLLEYPSRQRFRGKRIGMIFQEPITSLNPLYTCGFQVIETIRQHQTVTAKQAEQQMLQLFQEVRLTDPQRLQHRYPHELSGGQLQRIMIAMALSGNPEILIADEPTTALDVTVQATILQLLAQLRKQRKMALILISHDLGVVSQVADWVAVMYQGKIVEWGGKEIFSNPQHPYTRGLIACRPRLHVRLKYLPTLSDYMTEKDGIVTAKMPNNARLGECLVTPPRPPDQVPLLEVAHLRVEYRVGGNWEAHCFVAVNDVSFAIYPGETLGMVGESGCGKTTIARTLVGLIRPTSGAISFLGHNWLQARRRHLRREIQMIFQDPLGSLDPRLTIEETLLEPLHVHHLLPNDREKKAQVLSLLEKVGLDRSALSRYPHAFSGGQRQRISIARALILKPKLIIADEAVSALDVSVQAQVLNLLKAVQKEFNLSYLFISHDLSVVRFMSDHILVMNKGKIVEEGNSDRVYENPQSAYTTQLIASIPTLNI